MGGNGKHRWKISFYRRSNSNHKSTHPPKEFLCPISGSLMYDPVVVSSGQTFERVSVQVCRDLNFAPSLDDGSIPDLTTVIPNLAIKSTILNWCDTNGAERPLPPDYSSVEKAVRKKMVESKTLNPENRVSESELLKAVAENPPVLFSHAQTELTRRVNHFYSSSSEESMIVNNATASPFNLLPFATRPACYTSSSNSSSEIAEAETLTQNPDSADSSSNSSFPEEEEIVAKLRSPEVYEQEEAVISLRKLTRAREEMRIPLCTHRLLTALRSLIASRYCVVQTNAIAALVNLSLEKANKVKIVRSGFVPLLIDLLTAGSSEPQEHAAGALFSLALEDENKMTIGVLGALHPLMHALRAKLVKLGAVPTLLGMIKAGDLASRLLLILCNLAAGKEGRSAMLDGNAVAILVGMLSERSERVDLEATQEYCVAALLALSHGSLRFKGLAKEARAVEVLREIEERGNDRAREKAKKILQMMRKGDEDDEEADREAVLESGGAGRSRYRVGGGARNGNCPNSSNF
ncbi:hypothetical protein GH714_043310 [Hevea brasiliensis]|uniref:RING-type E3 ubiquitin transferase n=1 Tax=Hevea brasiliensis TaxID=3981 RepID=A0A6A6K278_HEVBR|nr:hypothetical protein GH714_043310 [Hevea brasiliensis]